MNRPGLPVAHHRPGTVTGGRVPGAKDERGVVGGFEVLPFGLLIFVVGALVVANAWAVIDTKMATASAAREAARVYVEAPSAGAGATAAQRAAEDAMASYGRDPRNLDLTFDSGTSFERCARMTFTASSRVRAIALPFGIGFGHGFTVSSTHTEIIDPLRNGLGTRNACGY